jgi:hypothetical protein
LIPACLLCARAENYAGKDDDRAQTPSHSAAN